MNVCLPRSREATLLAVRAVDPEHTPDLQPGHGGRGWTHCNLAVERFAQLLQAPFPSGLLANDQVAWLEELRHGWMRCTPAEAQAAADAGHVVIVGWKNPDPGGHGHIAAVLPSQPGRAGIWIAQAGSRNYNAAPVTAGFGGLGPLRFFSHP